MIAHHRSTLISAALGAGIVLLYLWARAAFAAADDPPPLVIDAGALDRAALIAPAPADVAPDDPPPAAKPSPGIVDHILDVAGPVGRGALGGIACLAVAWLLARGRERWGWLRRGAAGNLAATAYAALATFGGVLAIGGSVGAGLTAVGGAMAAGMALVRDPETVRAKAVSGEEVPT